VNSAQSQLVLRQAERLKNQSVLLVNPTPDSLCRELSVLGCQVSVFTQDYGDYQSFANQSGFEHEFGHWLGSGSFERIILFHAKEKRRSKMLLDMLKQRLSGESEIWVVGAKKAGIASVKNSLKERFNHVGKIDTARHCQLFCARQPDSATVATLGNYQSFVSIKLEGVQFQVCNLPGVFSQDELDPATEMLLSHLPSVDGSVLDFGCGNGVIGAFLAKQYPTIQLHCIDVSAMALEATRQTMLHNQLDAQVEPSFAFSQLNKRFDWIVSNPPFHRGVDTDYEAAHSLIYQAHQYLNKKGHLLIVANRFLPYSGWLADCFNQCRILVENNRFIVYLAWDSKDSST